MTSDAKVIERLQDARGTLRPAQLALLLDEICDSGLTQGSLVTYFKRAFPELPLRTLLEAGAWNRVSGGKLTDDDFDKLLAPWLN